MKRFIAIIIVAVFCTAAGYAQDSLKKVEQPSPLKNKIGFAASMLSGYGLSYGYSLSKGFALEFTGSIYGSGGSGNTTYSSNNNTYLVATLGAEIQKTFYNGQENRFYAFGAFSYWVDNSNYYSGVTSTNDSYTHDIDYVGGLGLGWEFLLGKRFILNVEGGYLYRDINITTAPGNYDPVNQKQYPVSTTNSYDIGFGVGAGIYYAF